MVSTSIFNCYSSVYIRNLQRSFGLTLAAMLAFPNAKINLGLHITRKRTDGFHELETIFYPVKTMKDALEIVPAKTDVSKLHLSGLQVDGDTGNNLVWRAYELIKESYPERVPALDIYLLKAIPMGAGLGGGSADAAFALQLLNEYCQLDISDAELEKLALQLGSDCPFFIRNSPQYATGRGEIMEPIDIDLSEYRIEVVCPEVHVSTKEAFSGILPKPGSFDLRELPKIPVPEWKQVLKNDFEPTVFKQYPEIARIKEKFYADGALYASMSGSGSAVYGIFEK